MAAAWIPRFLRCSSALVQQVPNRTLSVMEHQGLKLLKELDIPCPEHEVITNVDQATEAMARLGGSDFVLKALVPTGGRGLGVFDNGLKGGVQMICSEEEAVDIASKMIGHYLKTKQTGDKGLLCEKLLLAKRHFLRREYYFSITLDRMHNGPVLIGCGQGGMSIEKIAAEDPDAIVYLPVDVVDGIDENKAREMISKMGFTPHCQDQALEIFKKLYSMFIKYDCNLVEINPMAEDSSGNCTFIYLNNEILFNFTIHCMDCKVVVDDAAAYRQKELFAMVGQKTTNELEQEAAEFNLNYIPLEGDIACLVNGAGLAMATMDIIKLHGGEPANFLDIGGGASIDQVSAAFRIISKDSKVRAILVNIFGGILRCDVIATGVCRAAKDLNLTVPIVCRLQGTKVDDAKAVITANQLKVLAVDNLDDAAKMSVKLASIMNIAKEVALDVSFELPI
ncbi:putative succinyl-CoA ligase [ADP-forming] subunit beta, mitochondrial [Trichinella nativa]|uniref:Succinate--CoA ligase [ADP-forming] subunit beta, mitochondrial n=1 Tax=Trichinella nativa TaxID=6335 RepID=A0A0V1L1Q1_9BILA|nr:putative succinyl-CoA ligase [ADP-forming] subunit beta, mitochondrial [Trichinella nativa]